MVVTIILSCGSNDVPITKPKDFNRDVESIFGAGPGRYRCALCAVTLTHEAAVHRQQAGWADCAVLCVFWWVKITEDHDDNNNKDSDGDEDRTDDI